MTNYFYTYEANHCQPHECLQDAASWLEDYDVSKVIEIEYDNEGDFVWAWDRTAEAEKVNALKLTLVETLKAARNYQPEDEAERAAMDRFAAKLPPWGARYVEV